jgi:hypothetical protein
MSFIKESANKRIAKEFRRLEKPNIKWYSIPPSVKIFIGSFIIITTLVNRIIRMRENFIRLFIGESSTRNWYAKSIRVNAATIHRIEAIVLPKSELLKDGTSAKANLCKIVYPEPKINKNVAL